MLISTTEAQRRVGLFTDALRAAGMRMTHQRLEVVREIALTDEHPDVEHIYRRVRTRVPTISLDTVYRTLATLTELGLVVRVTLTPGPTRYDANTSNHHHYVCTQCGMIHDVEDPELDAVRTPTSVAAIGNVSTVEVQLRGICTECEMQGEKRLKGARS